MTVSMGIGKLGNSNIVFSSKRRWTAEVISQDGTTTHLKQTFVKVSAKPLNDQEKECSQSNDFVYECKYKERQQLTITFIDVTNEELTPLYKWLGTVYELTANKEPVPRPELTEKLILRMYNAVGEIISTDILKDVFPVSINFGDLDHSSSETLTIELTFSYSEVEFRDEFGIAHQKKD